MKKSGFIFSVILALFSFIFPLRLIGAPAYDAGAAFSDVEGREWVLSEFTGNGKVIRIDRQKLSAIIPGDAYTIRFNEGQVNGIAAPNRYFGPYTAGANRTLVLGNVASTMMAAFNEPDELKEYEYFGYLGKITRWDLRNGKLELHGSGNAGGDGTAVILVYAPK